MAHDPKGLLEVPAGIKPLAVPAPATTKWQTHMKKSGDLFPNPPSPKDIVQGNIGDCFFLGALISISELKNGPELIERMMRDNGDYTVTVRMWKEDSKSWNYILIGKTLIYEFFSTRVLHAKGALWVGILEKAYLAFIDKRSYATYEGGNSTRAFRALLGDGADDLGFSKTLMATEDDLESWRRLKGGYDGSYLLKNPKDIQVHRQFVLQRIFGGDEALYRKWISWYTRAHFEKLGSFLGLLNEFERYFMLNCPDSDLRNLIVTWVAEAKVLNQFSAPGRYTAVQMDRFRRIQRYLAMNIPVAAGTKRHLPGAAAGLGRSAGEGMVGGLAAPHVYGILGAKTDTTTGLLWVRLRNPWGDTGRGYTIRQVYGGTFELTPKQIKDGEFWMELDDFTKCYDDFYFGPQARTAAEGAFRQNLAADLQKQKLALKPLKP
jgi:hypothetical protein